MLPGPILLDQYGYPVPIATEVLHSARNMANGGVRFAGVEPVDSSDGVAVERDRALGGPKAIGQVAQTRAYAKGDQPIVLTPGQVDELRGLLGNDYADNLILQILTINNGRLRLEGFGVEDEDAAVLGFIGELVVKWQLDALHSQVHFATIRDGDHCLAVTYDDDSRLPVPVQEAWWDGDTGMYVAYNAFGKPAYAVKEWWETDERGDPVKFRTIYLRDRIRRFVRRERSTVSAAGVNGGTALTVAGQGSATWEPITQQIQTRFGAIASVDFTPFTRPNGEPLGIPVVHFSNKAQSSGFYGRSETPENIRAGQDHINGLHMALLANGLETGFQMIFISGIEAARDKDGNPLPMKTGPREVIVIGDPGGKAGAIEPGNADSLIKILHEKRQTMCNNTGTPYHLIAGEWPSGEALLRAEAPLSDKAQKQVDVFSPAWASVMHLATKLANARGDAGLDESKLITARFASTIKREILVLAQAVMNLKDILPDVELYRLLGYGPTEIATLMEEMDKQRGRVSPIDQIALDRQRLALEQDRAAGAPDGTGTPADVTARIAAAAAASAAAGGTPPTASTT